MQKTLRLNRTQTILLALCLFLLAVVLLPSTGIYKAAVRGLWRAGYHTASYYLTFSDPSMAMEMGSYYFGAQGYDLDMAAGSYERAVKLQPNVFNGHYQLARIYFVKEDNQKALQEINEELAANPSNLRSLYVRGLIEDSQHNLSSAEADFTRFIAWAPTEWGGYNDLAYVLARERKFAQSEATVLQGMQKVPNGKDIPWLWNSLGLAQLNELHYNQALESFDTALALSKTITPAQWYRAYSANSPATAAEGIQNFQNAIQNNIATAQRGDAL